MPHEIAAATSLSTKATKARMHEEARLRQTMLDRIAEPPDGSAPARAETPPPTVDDVRDHPDDPDGQPDATKGQRRW